MNARGSIRREVRITEPADDIWRVVGDPARLYEWFPGVVTSTVEGTTRVITTAAGIPMPEELLTIDPVQRRFQYRLKTSLVREHLATIDVIDLGDSTSLVVYATDAEPSVMALVLGGAAGNALENLRTMMEEGVI